MFNLTKPGKACIAFLLTTVMLSGFAHAQDPDLLVKMSDGQAFGGGSLTQSILFLPMFLTLHRFLNMAHLIFD